MHMAVKRTPDWMPLGSSEADNWVKFSTAECHHNSGLVSDNLDEDLYFVRRRTRRKGKCQ